MHRAPPRRLQNTYVADCVADCLRRATQARKRADRCTDDDLREAFLNIARRWLFIARGFGYTEYVQGLVEELERRRGRRAVVSRTAEAAPGPRSPEHRAGVTSEITSLLSRRPGSAAPTASACDQRVARKAD